MPTDTITALVFYNTLHKTGQCTSKVDFKNFVFEPQNEVKGLVAHISFHMHDPYNLKMSEQQQRLFTAWNQQYPMSAWERKCYRRIAKVTAHHNEFVSS